MGTLQIYVEFCEDGFVNMAAEEVHELLGEKVAKVLYSADCDGLTVERCRRLAMKQSPGD